MWGLDKNPQKWDSSMAMVNKTSVWHFKVKNTPRKHSDGKETSKECLVFFKLTKEGFSLLNCPSRNLKFTEFSLRPIGALGLFWYATKQRSFWRIFKYILYCIIMKITCLWTFYLRRFIHFEIGLSALIWDLCWIIFAMCSADFTYCGNRSTSQICITRIAFKH